MPPHVQVEHCIQREPAGCLAACAQMALAVIGVRQSQESLNQLLGLTSLGVPVSQIGRLGQLGVSVLLGKGDEHTLRDHLMRGLPTIVFLSTGELPYWEADVRHAVLVVGTDNAHVLLTDPAFSDAPKIVGWGDFMLAWSEFGYRYAVIGLR